MPITMRHKGDFKNLEKVLSHSGNGKTNINASKIGEAGVASLAAATPKDTGKTASSWRYEVNSEGGKTQVSWVNDNVNDGQNVALLIQYGHGTGTGGYVPGVDYINPAIQPVLDSMSDEVWKEVTTK